MKIVYAYVVGDIIHEGHFLHLENAKALGDKLIVGVLTDKAVMEKKSKPILPFGERLRSIKRLKCVDVVVAQDTYSPIENIRLIQPDIHIESSSHTDEDLKKISLVCESRGIRVVKLPYYPEQSSTKIKEDLKNAPTNE